MESLVMLKIQTGTQTRDESKLSRLPAHPKTCTRCFSSLLRDPSVVNSI